MITPLTPPRLSPNALTALRQHYLAKNERGVAVESPADMFHRVAKDIASAEPLTSCPVLMYNPAESASVSEWALLNIYTKLTAYGLGDKYFSRLYEAVC